MKDLKNVVTKLSKDKEELSKGAFAFLMLAILAVVIVVFLLQGFILMMIWNVLLCSVLTFLPILTFGKSCILVAILHIVRVLVR